ncbi:MAG: hypothetical protein WC238_05295 [Parcubacteria group bacterium]|jgi:hypothetical protein
MEEKFVDQNDVYTIVNSYNNLIERSDEDRRIFSKLLLTIYTPVSSGLLFLSINLSLENNHEKITFFAISLTSILIVFSALAENFGYYLISKNAATTYINNVKKTGKHYGSPLGGTKWQDKLVEWQIYIMVILITINLSSVLYFVFIRINFYK